MGAVEKRRDSSHEADNEVERYMEMIEKFNRYNSDRIVDQCIRNIKLYTAARPKTKRAERITDARLKAMSLLLDKHRQLKLF